MLVDEARLMEPTRPISGSIQRSPVDGGSLSTLPGPAPVGRSDHGRGGPAT